MFDKDRWVLMSHMISQRSSFALSSITFDQELEEDCIFVLPSPSTTSPTISNISTTWPFMYIINCDEVCLSSADPGLNGECCMPYYCDCESYGNFQMECNEEDTLWCPAQNDCISNCHSACDNCHRSDDNSIIL